jgi:hypothetical protein
MNLKGTAKWVSESAYGFEDLLLVADSIFVWLEPKIRPLVSGKKLPLPKTRSSTIKSPATSVPITKGSIPIRRLDRSVIGLSPVIVEAGWSGARVDSAGRARIVCSGPSQRRPHPLQKAALAPKLVARNYDLAPISTRLNRAKFLFECALIFLLVTRDDELSFLGAADGLVSSLTTRVRV